MEHFNITMALAILLGTGFLAAKAGNLLKLPSVTGYICAGLFLGPSGINVIPSETIGHQLEHFTQIALMMIAFGIGEHLEIKRIKPTAKSVGLIGIGETTGTFLFVFFGSFFVAMTTKIGLPSWTTTDYLALSILLAAVSVATAPAATLHVMRELKANGPLTSTLLAVVAIDDGLAIMIFGIAVSVTHHLMAAGNGSLIAAVGASLFEIGGSLAIGFLAGRLIDFVNNRLKSPGEMLTAGLAILLLCGETARLLHFSPLLAGMAAGFTIVNHDHRDMRLFRALNSFEPPIYVLFFTLAGLHLNLQSLVAAGWLGLSYFILRFLGKICGAGIGAKIAAAPKKVQKYLGLALTPQAGVAIGLIFLISGDKAISEFATILTPVVLAGVFLSELVGPVCAKQAVRLAGEVPEPTREKTSKPQREHEPHGVPMTPWTWDKLQQPLKQDGVVIFGANHIATTRALARMAAIFANYHEACPMAVRIIPETEIQQHHHRADEKAIMLTAQTEMFTMGSEMQKTIHQSDDTAQGILAIARQNRANGIILGHCQDMTPAIFQKVIGEVVTQAPCSTIVIKFAGVLHTERILVPVINMRELYTLRHVIQALSRVGKHQITILRLLPSYETEKNVLKATKRLKRWADMECLSQETECIAIATDARQETITEEAEKHDLLIMSGPKVQGIQRLVFGSLVHAVARKCPVTMITVYPASN